MRQCLSYAPAAIFDYWTGKVNVPVTTAETDRTKILDGLSYLNSAGFEHRSLSCSNILLDLVGNIRIGMNLVHDRIAALLTTHQVLWSFRRKVLELPIRNDQSINKHYHDSYAKT